MTDHDCFTDQQGHLPCTCSKFMQENSDGSDAHQSNNPWDWIDDLAYPIDRALLIACALAIVAIAYRIFH